MCCHSVMSPEHNTTCITCLMNEVKIQEIGPEFKPMVSYGFGGCTGIIGVYDGYVKMAHVSPGLTSTLEMVIGRAHPRQMLVYAEYVYVEQPNGRWTTELPAGIPATAAVIGYSTGAQLDSAPVMWCKMVDGQIKCHAGDMPFSYS